MVAEQVMPKYSKNIKFMVILIIVFSWLCGLGVHIIGFEAATNELIEYKQKVTPLLLNSDVVQAKEAEVSVVLWFESGNVPKEVWTEKPTQDWIWTYKELSTRSGITVVTLSGHRLMNRNEESKLYAWYTVMAQQLAKTGGRIYLDERISQAIDISAYLSNMNTLPAQWALSGNLLSIAAYQSNIPEGVIAGKDRINIQLLSRGKNTDGQTVLAIPVLLEEF